MLASTLPSREKVRQSQRDFPATVYASIQEYLRSDGATEGADPEG